MAPDLGLDMPSRRNASQRDIPSAMRADNLLSADFPGHKIWLRGSFAARSFRAAFLTSFISLMAVRPVFVLSLFQERHHVRARSVPARFRAPSV
jgi:hypothetical protein